MSKKRTALLAFSLAAIGAGCGTESTAADTGSEDAEAYLDADNLSKSDWVGVYTSVNPSAADPTRPYVHERFEFTKAGNYSYWHKATASSAVPTEAVMMEGQSPVAIGNFKIPFLRPNQVKLYDFGGGGWFISESPAHNKSALGVMRLKTVSGIVQRQDSDVPVGSLCSTGCTRSSSTPWR